MKNFNNSMPGMGRFMVRDPFGHQLDFLPHPPPVRLPPGGGHASNIV